MNGRFLIMVLAVSIILSLRCEDTVTFTLSPTDTNRTDMFNNKIFGQVFTSCSYPEAAIAGAIVELQSDSLRFRTVSDSSGAYHIAEIPPGDYRLIASAFRYYDTTVAWVYHLRPNENLRFDLQMTPAKDSYAPGSLLMSVWDTVSVFSVFHLVDTLDVDVRAFAWFRHTTVPLTLDSARSILNLLQSKAYLSAFPPKLNEHGDSSTVTVDYLFGMNRTYLLDWLETVRSLKLIELPDPYKYVTLRTAVGQECELIQRLKKTAVVRSITLNYLAYIS
jgi:hypothetical protein